MELAPPGSVCRTGGGQHERGRERGVEPGDLDREMEQHVRDPDRELLLRAFAAQSAIDWPALDALLGFTA